MPCSRCTRYNYGVMLWHGADDEPDEQEAVKWWLKAATMGYRPAQVDLAYAYAHHSRPSASLSEFSPARITATRWATV